MDWIYEDKKFILSDYPSCFGFIYLIEYSNDKKYIGKRHCFKEVTLPRNKNRKKKEVFLREDVSYRRYSGSHKTAKGLKVVKKSILALANTKRSLTYLEVKCLMEVDAIFNSKFLNENIGGKYFDNVLDDLKKPLRKEYR